MLKCVIFDLDGVLVSTDEYHYQAWKQLAQELQIPFDRHDNLRLRGVSRMDSLNIVLEKSSKTYSQDEKKAMADKKNGIYKGLLKNLTPDDSLPAAKESLIWLHSKEILTAVGSSSCNAGNILHRIGLDAYLDTVITGLDITHSKPHPEVFAKAAQASGCLPEECLVVEDADSGVAAGKAAGMKVLALSTASQNPDADFSAPSLKEVFPHWQEILSSFADR